MIKSFAFILLSCCAQTLVAQQQQQQPETVMVTYHARRGSEADLERVIAKHWETARRLKLVNEAPHVTMRGSETGGLSYFVDVFTWKSAAIPDAAPAEIRQIWDEMNKLVEARGGQFGLEFTALTLLAPAIRK